VTQNDQIASGKPSAHVTENLQSDDEQAEAPPNDLGNIRSLGEGAESLVTKERIPQTLHEFVLAKKVATAEFVKLKTKKPPTQAEIDEALTIGVPASTMVEKALELSRECIRRGSRPRSLLEWCELVLREQVPTLANWGRAENESTIESLRRLAYWAEAAREDKDDRKRVDGILAIGINLLILNRSLGALETLGTLWPIFRREIIRDGSISKVEERLKETISRNTNKTLRDNVAIVGLLDGQIQEANTNALAANHRAQEIEKERDSLRERAIEKDARIAKLEKCLAEKEKRIAELEAGAADLRMQRTYESQNLRARTRRVLDKQIDILLSDAWEALGIDPPIVEVAQERVEMARAEIRKEIEWLASGD
jgi:uncharacterized coiled-coil protein SlyX